jgi:hypothetical protein
MSLTGKGWRLGAADFLTALRDADSLSSAIRNGTISTAQFAALAAAVANTRAINTTAPLTGGGDLSADRTLAISAASGGAAGSMSAADFSKLAVYPATFNTGVSSGIQSSLFPGVQVTPEVDLTATTSATIQLIPVGPVGTAPVILAATFYLTTTAGTLSTGFAYQAGNDGAESNLIAPVTAPSTLALLSTPFATGAPVRAFSPAIVVTGVKAAAATTAGTLKITTGATGAGLTLKGHFVILYSYVAIV